MTANPFPRAAAGLVAIAPRRRTRLRLHETLVPLAAPLRGRPTIHLVGYAGRPVVRICRWVGGPLCHAGESALRRVGLEVQLDEVQVGAAALASAVTACVAPSLALPMIAVVAFAPAGRRRGRRRQDERALAAELPVVIELFRLAVGAGASIHQAVPAVASRSSPRFRDALGAVVAREAMGEPLADGLARLADLGAVVRPLATALAAAERDGSAIGDRLDRLAVEARLGHRRRAEEAARRLPVQLLFPLVGCILPAFGLLTVVPLLAASMPHLS